MSSEWRPGDVYVVERYPFVRTTFMQWDADGAYETKSWKPGIEYEIVGPEGESDLVCDGFGKQFLTVVSSHKPGKFPERVFYTRQWEDPEGVRFGKTNCRIAVSSKFNRLTQGFGAGRSDLQSIRLRDPFSQEERETSLELTGGV